MSDTLAALDGQTLVARFAAGEASPVALLQDCLAQIDRHDHELGIINDLLPQAGLLAAAQASEARWLNGNPLSALDGLPFLVKANVAVAGLPWHAGFAAFCDRIAQADAEAVAVLRRAGLNVLGTVNMHEGALGETSINPAYRNTRNPHATEHIAGGSSGGSAAAVAAGFAPLALGTDNMGSVRLPSAFCGVVGLKLAHGVVPVDGVVPLCPSLDHVGMHARSVADARDVAALFTADVVEQEPVGAVRVCRWRLAEALEIAPDLAAVVTRVLADFADVSELDWSDVDLSAVRRAGLLRCERDVGDYFASELAANPDGFSTGFRELTGWGMRQGQDKVDRYDALLETISGRLQRELENAVLISATTTHLAPEVAGPAPATLADLTAPAAIAGLPAIAVPVGYSEHGLPLSVQIAGSNLAAVLDVAQKICPTAVALASGCQPK